MRKFKLIKAYPGHKDKVGCVYVADVDGINGPVINVSGIYIKPLDFPEHFKEVTEIKYSVGTRAFNEDTDTFYTRKEDGWYKSPDKTAHTDESIHRNKNVKVLSNDKEPIFTTEDGVAMFEGDKYYYTNNKFSKYDSIVNDNINFYNRNSHIKRFANSIARDKYIEENKPLYSLKDVEKAINGVFNGRYSTDEFIINVQRILRKKNNDSK